MTSIVEGFSELMHRIQFFTFFSLNSSEMAYYTKNFPKVYDNLGKSFSKYESHP